MDPPAPHRQGLVQAFTAELLQLAAAAARVLSSGGRLVVVESSRFLELEQLLNILNEAVSAAGRTGEPQLARQLATQLASPTATAHSSKNWQTVFATAAPLFQFAAAAALAAFLARQTGIGPLVHWPPSAAATATLLRCAAAALEMHGGPTLDCPQDLRTQGVTGMKWVILQLS